MDVYECVAASDITDALFSSARLAWAQALILNAQADQLLARTTLLPTMSGSTPYQAPGFAKYWKVIKKTRVLCGPSSKTNYTYFTKPKYINNSKIIGQYATKGLTKDLIIITNPTFNSDTTAISQLNTEWSKSYAIKMDDMPGLQTQWAYQIVY